MMKKKTGLSLMLFLSLLICVFLNNAEVHAEEQLSQLSFEHLSIESLTQDQQNRLVKERPQGVVKADKEFFTLVYQPVKVGSSGNSTHLPKTNGADNSWLMLSGLGLVTFAFVLFRKKRKSVRLLVAVIGTSVAILTFSSAVVAAPAPLLATVTQTAAKKTPINYQVPVINGYQYVGYLLVEENNNGTVPTVGNGKVTVNYLDESGKALTDSVILTGTIGTEYRAEKKAFADYDFVNVTGDSSGFFTDTEQIITFNYQKKTIPPLVEKGTVIYKYQNTQGEMIHPDVSAEGKIGEVIPENKLEIPGYRYSATINGDDRKFSSEQQVIIYQYQAQGQLSFKLKIKDPYTGSSIVNVREYILQHLSQGESLTTIQFAKYDSNWQNIEPVPELSGATFTDLLNGQELELINDMGVTFGSITDSKKDDINRLLNYQNYTGRSVLVVLYNYNDSAGETKTSNLLIDSVTTNPMSLDDVEFANEQEVTIELTISVPN
ncbi:LPXTG cell wall anchor domain-containing protein [Erwinia sp. CPCC 100877]|nr:LPXTG cell wall anchor domain-containing protein [Erwinia sp. CPCC 100877]